MKIVDKYGLAKCSYGTPFYHLDICGANDEYFQITEGVKILTSNTHCILNNGEAYFNGVCPLEPDLSDSYNCSGVFTKEIVEKAKFELYEDDDDSNNYDDDGRLKIMYNEKLLTILKNFDPEYDFCVDCKYFGEPNGCNRENGPCTNYELFNEMYDYIVNTKLDNETIQAYYNSLDSANEKYNFQRMLEDTNNDIYNKMSKEIIYCNHCQNSINKKDLISTFDIWEDYEWCLNDITGDRDWIKNQKSGYRNHCPLCKKVIKRYQK